ncbi:alpha/beta hydrolase [Sorangium cellulosum]|uniref:Alpha/beta hydrolase n=1 Tax=Sorangium cellulosum TaxID=56 RepID=A0A2L0F4W2_SORCE|nr:alpha/beta hydrolase [Sorangium cellulosum]AUX46610.1 alpha/beta hydrolase [Sorangium cellulosum]
MEGSVLRHVVARDGTRIAWHTHQRPGDEERLRDRAPIVLTNGLSTTENFWKHLVSALATTTRLVHWSYRGHGQSETARSGDYAVRTHTDDLLRVTEAVRADGTFAGAPVHIAFSMGVTVLLELYRRRPDLVRAMVLIAGGADHPYASSAAFRIPGTRGVVRGALRTAAPIASRIAPVVRRITASRAIFPLGRAAGVFGPEAPRDELEHFLRAVGTMDPHAYWESLRSLMEARASDVLPHVRVPVLVIAPERDVMALRADLDTLRRLIPGAEWMVVPRTGHAMLLEAGGVVSARIREFLLGLR